MLKIPYTRLLQILATVGRVAAAENRASWSRAAFIGWQNYLMQPVKGKHTDFRKWLIDFGIVAKKPPTVKAAEIQSDKNKALANAKRVMAAFGRRKRRA